MERGRKGRRRLSPSPFIEISGVAAVTYQWYDEGAKENTQRVDCGVQVVPSRLADYVSVVSVVAGVMMVLIMVLLLLRIIIMVVVVVVIHNLVIGVLL